MTGSNWLIFALLPARKAAGAIFLAVVAGLALAALYFCLDPAQHPFPPCPVHWLTGLHCPGCGTQRALHALLHGRFAQAAGFNLLAALCTPVVAAGLLEEARIQLTGQPRRHTLLYRPWLSWGAVVLALLFAVLRNLPGPLGAWLAP